MAKKKVITTEEAKEIALGIKAKVDAEGGNIGELVDASGISRNQYYGFTKKLREPSIKVHRVMKKPGPKKGFQKAAAANGKVIVMVTDSQNLKSVLAGLL